MPDDVTSAASAPCEDGEFRLDRLEHSGWCHRE